MLFFKKHYSNVFELYILSYINKLNLEFIQNQVIQHKINTLYEKLFLYQELFYNKKKLVIDHFDHISAKYNLIIQAYPDVQNFQINIDLINKQCSYCIYDKKYTCDDFLNKLRDKEGEHIDWNLIMEHILYDCI